jgi:hypothetical protein
LAAAGKSIIHHVKAPELIILLKLEDCEEYGLLGRNGVRFGASPTF